MALPRRLLDALLLSCVLHAAFSATATADPKLPTTALIGVASVDITPDTPIRMYGYGSRTTESQGVAGPLRAKALAIGSNDGQGPAILLTVDCGAVPGDIRQAVYQRVNEKTPHCAGTIRALQLPLPLGTEPRRDGVDARGRARTPRALRRADSPRVWFRSSSKHSRTGNPRGWHWLAAAWDSRPTDVCSRTASGPVSVPFPELPSITNWRC